MRLTTRLSPLVAGIVVFHPETERLARLAAALLTEADRLVVVLNSDVDAALRQGWAADPRVTLVEPGGNRGVGEGLNRIAREAERTGAGAVALFDQDSRPPPGLLGRLQGAWEELEAAGLAPGVVAPRLVAADSGASKPPRYRFTDRAGVGRIRPVLFVPTSGSLIATAVLDAVGPFRADYFIDGIDLEWCFRAAARGRGSWVATDCLMVHSVGTGTIGARRLGWRMPRQRPFRMHCLVRNTLYGLRLRHIPFGWKLRQLLYLPVQMGAFALHHRLHPAVIGLLLAGVRDGLTGHLGAPPGMPGDGGRRAGPTPPPA